MVWLVGLLDPKGWHLLRSRGGNASCSWQPRLVWRRGNRYTMREPIVPGGSAACLGIAEPVGDAGLVVQHCALTFLGHELLKSAHNLVPPRHERLYLALAEVGFRFLQDRVAIQLAQLL